MRLRQHASTIAVAVACVAVAAALPALAHGVEHALFAHDADKADGFHATGAGTSAAGRAGKLVATNADGQLPNNIIDKAPDANRLDGRDSSDYQQDLGRVITVAKSGGDFTSVAAALQSISDSNASRRYVVRVGPGVFQATALEVPPFVTLEGAGREATELAMSTVSDPRPPAVELEPNATVRALTISDDDHRTAISAGSHAVIEEVSVDLDNGGIGVEVFGDLVRLDDVDIDIVGAFGSSFGVTVRQLRVMALFSVQIEHSHIAVNDETAAAVQSSGLGSYVTVRWSYLSSTLKTAAQAFENSSIVIASSELDEHVSGNVRCKQVWTPDYEVGANECPPAFEG